MLENPEDGSGLILRLMAGLSAYRVFKALDKLVGTEEELELLITNRAFLELVDEVSVVFRNISDELNSMQLPDPEAYVKTIASHYPQALDAAAELAELLEVNPQDLVSVLLEL